jgi:hypothetical protein
MTGSATIPSRYMYVAARYWNWDWICVRIAVR